VTILRLSKVLSNLYLCSLDFRVLHSCFFSTGYQAQNITTNITVPSFGEIPVMMVNGWIILQQRLDSSFSFYQDWFSYQYGFGSIGSDYWMGNELVYQIVSSGQYKLRMEMLAWGGGRAYLFFALDLIESCMIEVRLADK
jgi:hypothetical protein